MRCQEEDCQADPGDGQRRGWGGVESPGRLTGPQLARSALCDCEGPSTLWGQVVFNLQSPSSVTILSGWKILWPCDILDLCVTGWWHLGSSEDYVSRYLGSVNSRASQHIGAAPDRLAVIREVGERTRKEGRKQSAWEIRASKEGPTEGLILEQVL